MTLFTFDNNVNTTLSAAVASGATTLTLSSSTGLPTSIPSGQSMALTLRDAATRLVTEIVYATAVSGSTLTVVRGQEGTAAVAWSTGDYAYSGPTAGQMANVIQNGSAAGGDLTGTYPSPTLAINRVQNGTGVGQLSGNTIKIGWTSAATLKATVDATDLGIIVTASTPAGGDLTGTYPNPTLATARVVNSSPSNVVKIGYTGTAPKANLTVDTTSFGNIVTDSVSYWPFSQAASGYQKFPNGLVVMWGQANLPANQTAQSVTLPTTFPNACLAAIGSYGSSVPPVSGTCGFDPLNTGQIRAICMATAGGPYGVWYIAIGY